METTNMNYRFLWDTEPTDEQLQAIMHEVGEDVQREQKELQKTILENIQRATTRACARQMQNA